jgi:hypothetical protein
MGAARFDSVIFECFGPRNPTPVTTRRALAHSGFHIVGVGGTETFLLTDAPRYPARYAAERQALRNEPLTQGQRALAAVG